jgi:hypothetical protein
LEQSTIDFACPYGAPDSPVQPDYRRLSLTSDASDCCGSRPLVKSTVARGITIARRKSFEKVFSNSFAISQWYKNMISKAFSSFERFSPFFKCFSFG